MINFRFHVVSITAVFLALGIGIGIGTTFIDDATITRLEANLDDLEARLVETNTRNDELASEVGRLRERAEQFAGEASPRLLGGHLEDVPVMVLAVEGVDGASIDGVRQSVVDADAALWGTLWLTDRLALEDEEATVELAQIVRIISDDPARIRRLLVLELGDVLDDTLRPVRVPAEPDGTPVPTTSTTAPTPDDLLTDLVTSGFVDWEAGPDAPDEPALPRGARLLVVSGTGAVLAPEDLLVPLLGELTETGAVPVVAGSAAVGDDAEARRSEFVEPLREGAVGERLSTVDDLESFGGWAAAVLALEDAGQGRFGHYGVAGSADRLLPVLPEPDG